MSSDARRALAWAALAVVLVALWQSLTVQANYAGNWTGLFRIGATQSVPPAFDGRIVRHAHPHGYDGQYYLWIALDPTLRSGNAGAIDAPLYRARRILVPFLAWALAAGQSAALPAAYIAVIWLAIFGGVYWLARLFLARGLPPAFGLLFLAVPPVLIGIDSMTVDIALATLTAAFLWYSRDGRTGAVFVTLAAAVLVRESGALLPAAAVLAALWERRWRHAALFSLTLLPAAAWYAWLSHSVPRELAGDPAIVPKWFLYNLHVPIFSSLFSPLPYPGFSPAVRLIARALDATALFGAAAAFALAARGLRPFRFTAVQFALALHILFALTMTGRKFWLTPYGYTRPFVPLFVLILAAEPPAALRLAALACLSIDLRVLAELQSQFVGLWRWL